MIPLVQQSWLVLIFMPALITHSHTPPVPLPKPLRPFTYPAPLPAPSLYLRPFSIFAPPPLFHLKYIGRTTPTRSRNQPAGRPYRAGWRRACPANNQPAGRPYGAGRWRACPSSLPEVKAWIPRPFQAKARTLHPDQISQLLKGKNPEQVQGSPIGEMARTG